ncbi:hypothetical protein GR212_20880 [Rhizobium lusitanum]|uniref:Uncharacterized protein n=1 Tax=Rhizobium lusitanum TaxID=293958 RepID=A0A6L9UCN0_9HYPH|nr:hypothetical protein [Rhizobium lusitanum]NEI72042.1 hypothetical protein [Rhizobium lusitanum]
MLTIVGKGAEKRWGGNLFQWIFNHSTEKEGAMPQARWIAAVATARMFAATRA